MHSLYKQNMFYSIKDAQQIANALSNELSYVNQCRFYLVLARLMETNKFV
jgi:hypothetical protein